MEIDDDMVTYPDQAVLDTASKLRTVLREALGWGDDRDPLPGRGRGAYLTYALELPAPG
jgi:hypothetical protein